MLDAAQFPCIGKLGDDRDARNRFDDQPSVA
jgi:hypothetical protein